MRRVFTEYVRSLNAAPGAAIEPPGDAVWEKLRSALAGELRKRSLWSSPPSYLGVYGAGSWSDGDALDELLADCFSFIFIERLPSLTAQLRIKSNIEGLIFLSLRNFLYDVQKRHDPLGFRVYLVLRAALRLAVAEARALVLAGSPRIAADTVLGLLPGATASGGNAELNEITGQWASELLPELVTGRGQALEEVAERLARCIGGLAAHGFEVMAFQELAGSLKRAVRRCWSAVWRYEVGETGFEDGAAEIGTLVPLVRPETGIEERDWLEMLLTCMDDALDHFEARQRTREYLERLWVFLRSYSVEPAGAGNGDLPSRRRLAALLGIPRDRLPDLNSTLGELLTECRLSQTAERLRRKEQGS